MHEVHGKESGFSHHEKPDVGIRHFIISNEQTLSNFVSISLEMSWEGFQVLARNGAFYFNHIRMRNVDPFKIIKTTDYLRVHLNPRRFPVDKVNWSKQLIYEGQSFVVIHKPAGIPTHATVDNFSENALAQMQNFLGYELHTTHRIDQPTEGLLVFARDKSFQREFNELLKGKVYKEYEAWVEGHYKEDRLLEHWMKGNPKTPKELIRGSVSPIESTNGLANGSTIESTIGSTIESTNESTNEPPNEPQKESLKIIQNDSKKGSSGDSKEKVSWYYCRLQILSIEHLDREGIPVSKLSIQLLTGRTHQIRSQLSSVGYPILGDKMYGSQVSYLSPLSEKDFPMEAIALKSKKLQFSRRDGSSYVFEC